MANNAYVKHDRHEDLPPPKTSIGIIGWIYKNLFSTPANALLSLLGIGVVVWVVPPALNWMIFSATWTGDVEACRANADHACWIFIGARLQQFIYGQYLFDQRWRIDIVFAMLIVGILALIINRVPYKRYVATFMLTGFPLISWWLLLGGMLGLPKVPTSNWGGFTLTLVIALTGIVISLPLGVVLALGRRSHMPILRTLCVLFIELWRGVPLITVLFMASVMFPLFLPEGVTFNDLARAMIGYSLFAAAYQAEVVRGGLQAIPKGQYEGAESLGLSYWQKMRLIILPQALKIVIPGIVNTFIGLFKDTTLVLIIGLFDLLGIVQAANSDPNWAVRSVPYTGYVFTALVFWVCCFGMSLYSRRVERSLNTGHKR